MTAWDLLWWVLAVCGALIAAGLTVGVLVAMVQSLRSPRQRKVHRVSVFEGKAER